MMPLPEIIEALAAIERQVTGVKKAYQDVPESIGSFPSFINKPARGGLGHAASGLGVGFHTIVAELHIAREPLPQADRKAKSIIKPFWKMLAANNSLNGTVQTINEIRYYYGPLPEIGGETHMGVSFELDVKELDSDIVTSQ